MTFQVKFQPVLLFLAVMMIASSSCAGKSKPISENRWINVALSGLLIDQSNIPHVVNLSYGPAQSPYRKMESESIAVMWQYPTSRDGIQEHIYRFNSPMYAKNTYGEESQWPGSSIDMPKTVKLAANEFSLKCADLQVKSKGLSDITCRWIARYDELIVVLSSQVGNDRLTISQFVDLVQVADLQINQHRSKP